MVLKVPKDKLVGGNGSRQNPVEFGRKTSQIICYIYVYIYTYVYTFTT